MKVRKHTRRTTRPGVRAYHYPMILETPQEIFDRDLDTLRALGVSPRDFFALYSRLHSCAIHPVPGTSHHYLPASVDDAILLRRTLAHELASLLASYVPAVRPVAANDALPEGVLAFTPGRDGRSSRSGAVERTCAPSRPESGPFAGPFKPTPSDRGDSGPGEDPGDDGSAS